MAEDAIIGKLNFKQNKDETRNNLLSKKNMPQLEHYKHKSYLDFHNKHFAKIQIFENDCRKVNFEQTSL